MRLAHKSFFFFNDTATTEIYTLSLHDALPISPARALHQLAFLDGSQHRPEILPYHGLPPLPAHRRSRTVRILERLDRKSTRLNSSHANISYAVFCLKKKS